MDGTVNPLLAGTQSPLRLDGYSSPAQRENYTAFLQKHSASGGSALVPESGVLNWFSFRVPQIIPRCFSRMALSAEKMDGL